MTKKRLYEVAKELGVASDYIVRLFEGKGISKNIFATMSEDDVNFVKQSILESRAHGLKMTNLMPHLVPDIKSDSEKKDFGKMDAGTEKFRMSNLMPHIVPNTELVSVDKDFSGVNENTEGYEVLYVDKEVDKQYVKQHYQEYKAIRIDWKRERIDFSDSLSCVISELYDIQKFKAELNGCSVVVLAVNVNVDDMDKWIYFCDDKHGYFNLVREVVQDKKTVARQLHRVIKTFDASRDFWLFLVNKAVCELGLNLKNFVFDVIGHDIFFIGFDLKPFM